MFWRRPRGRVTLYLFVCVVITIGSSFHSSFSIYLKDAAIQFLIFFSPTINTIADTAC